MHYILMGGSYGCLPDYCAAYRAYADAVDGAADLYELGRDRRRTLKRVMYVDLGPPYGADYCEIVECDCDEPWVHSEMDEPEDWHES